MDFFEAAEISRKYPGSRFTRGPSGLFVVYLRDGRVISSSEQLAEKKSFHSTDVLDDRMSVAERNAASLKKQFDIAVAEINQLRTEIDGLKAAISKIPSTEWTRFEEAQRAIDENRKKEERLRIVKLAKTHKLSYEQLRLVVDNANTLGLSQEHIDFMRVEMEKKLPKGFQSFVVHASTDGQ